MWALMMDATTFAVRLGGSELEIPILLLGLGNAFPSPFAATILEIY
jgi:hypothetical protein